ncbi:MAG: cytochrome c oxidase subunit 3 family protein [Planctomycetaceae bacterium]|nr:cytochrome c oxidase subunit 3 family protein [Planctomycetaceae bacterium]
MTNPHTPAMAHHATSAKNPLAIQFDNLEQQRFAASLGMWSFLATEILFFGGAFLGYAVYRNWYPHAWAEASRQLDLTWGTINTAVLLGSSLTMALAVDEARQGKSRGIAFFLMLTMVFGTAFLGIKAYEYWHKWHEHLIPGTSFVWSNPATIGPAQLFFSFYFVLTGCHAVHMIIGMALLLIMWFKARRGDYTAEWHAAVENMGLYWHFVDCVWVFLFPLLYLVDRA